MIFNRRNWFFSFLRFVRAVLANAPKGSICAQLAKGAPLSSAQHWICRFPGVYALWRELGNVPKRILDQHEKGLFFSGLAPEKIAPECHPRDMEYKARIQGIQNLHKLRSGVTLGDEQLYLEGLADGWRLHICMGISERESAYSAFQKRD